MRAMFGCLAILLGAVSIALASRYGYKGADTLVDGVISAVVFGAIALCAFLFDAAAVRLWFMRHHVGSVAIGFIAAAALVVTFTNSLGAIAARGDTTLAERTKAVDGRKDDRAELKRLQAALTELGKYTPTDAAAVAAAKRAADTATSNRAAECDKRGPLCKQREIDEATAATKLATATSAKATSDRAAKIEADIAAVRARLGEGPAVQNPNPLGAALELMLGAGAAAFTAWQQAIVAAVFELCLVGVMVIYELLGQGRRSTELQAVANAAGNPAREADQAPDSAADVPRLAALPPPRRTARKSSNGGSVKSFVRDNLFPADEGERVDIKTVMHTYRSWCAEKGLAPVDLNGFLDEIEQLCRKLSIRIEVGHDQRVYCHGVKIEARSASVH